MYFHTQVVLFKFVGEMFDSVCLVPKSLTRGHFLGVKSEMINILFSE